MNLLIIIPQLLHLCLPVCYFTEAHTSDVLGVCQVCGHETQSLPLQADEQLQPIMPAVPAAWANLLPGADSGLGTVLVASHVVMLPHLLDKPHLSPFHDIVRQCPAVVFESKMIRLAVQYKWENNVWPKMKLHIAGYGCALVLATVATLMTSYTGVSESASARRLLKTARGGASAVSEDLTGSSGGMEIGGSEETATTVLAAAMMTVECLSLCNELWQLVRMGLKAYLSPWNILDSSASVCLLLGAHAHFAGSQVRVRLYGAFGVALKWLVRCVRHLRSCVTHWQ